jgi:uncharacterized protein GlcG (DUF336 family)
MTAPLLQFSPVLLDLEAAQEMTRVAVDAARAPGIPYTITVVDGGGSPQQDHDVAAAAVTACPA